MSQTKGDGSDPFRILISIPDTATETCLKTVQETAEGRNLSYHVATTGSTRNETLNRRPPVLTLKQA